MAYTPELDESNERHDWRAESERMMNMVGWGDDDSEDTSSVPTLISRVDNDHSSSSSEEEEQDEEDLPDWIKEGRAAASVIVEFTDGVLLEEFPFEVTSMEKNEKSTVMDEVRGKTSNNHDSEAIRWNGIEISKDRVNKEKDCSIPAQSNEIVEPNTSKQATISQSTVVSRVSKDSTCTNDEEIK